MRKPTHLQLRNLKEQVDKMDAKTVLKETGCLLDCYKNQYKATKEATYQELGSMILDYNFPTGQYTENTEYVLYDYNTCIADIGGYLGLLLGQSILGVYQLMASMKRPKIFSA